MKRTLLLALGLTVCTLAVHAQTARQLTRKIVPQQQQPAPARPGVAPGAGARPAAPVDPAKIKEHQSETEKNLVQYQLKRAEAGSAHAQYELGVRYLTGKGVEKDEKLARKWLQKSAKAKNPAALKKLTELKWPLEDPKEEVEEKAASAGKGERVKTVIINPDSEQKKE